MDFKTILPFLIPLIIVQFGLLFYTIHHVLKQDKFKIGTKKTWLLVVILLMNFIGPILYFIFGKED